MNALDKAHGVDCLPACLSFHVGCCGVLYSGEIITALISVVLWDQYVGGMEAVGQLCGAMDQ